MPLGYLKELTEYWRTNYDWRRHEALLNEFPQFTTEIGGQTIHFLHVRSPEPTALPLLIRHGYPGSIVEFMNIIRPLANPRLYGGADNWDELLWAAGSLKLGTVTASEFVRTLRAGSRTSTIAAAIAEVGRMAKSLSLLSYVDDAAHRRMILVQLNRHELSRKIFHGRRGEVRKRYLRDRRISSVLWDWW